MHYEIIIIVILIIYIISSKLYETFKNLKTRVKIELPGKRFKDLPALDPDTYYKKMYANRDYVLGELIDEWFVQPKTITITKTKINKNNAVKKLSKDNKWYVFATKDIRKGEEIIII